MSPKRSWEEVDSAGDQNAQYPRPTSSASDAPGEADARRKNSRSSPSDHHNQQHIPMISRKVKACAACRKHKIKCIMDDGNPPCRRCVEKGLGCVLNKSLQTLISERSESTEAMSRDLEMIHSSLQGVLKTLDLPSLGSLQSCSKSMLRTPLSDEHHHFDEVGPSCDNSPKISPADDHDLPNVPIQSVYHLTKLSALRSLDANGAEHPPKPASNAIDDFISRGLVSLPDAERLFRLYMEHLDAFIYGVGGRYQTLDELRRASRLLTVSLLTVAALHDPQSNVLYGICSKEFRRLMAGSIFSRHIDRDYLRAMCIASYWLSDISWMLSGYASRRAAEFDLLGQYRRAITEHSEEAGDYVRLWYMLYICDQHLSTLFARPSVIREDIAIQGHEAFWKSPVANKDDSRLVSQVALLSIIHSMRELFGPDLGDPLPQVYLIQIATFSRRLDQWVGQWSPQIREEHPHIGAFPRKGALMHFHFAKLYLYSHVFRGLRDFSIPSHFLDCAKKAIDAGTAIINLLITDSDLGSGLAGMPSYLHSMTAFACMFLAKLAMIRGDELIERSMVIEMMTSLIERYRSAPVGKWHLVNLMADGLEKIVKALSAKKTQGAAGGGGGASHNASVPAAYDAAATPGGGGGGGLGDMGSAVGIGGLDDSSFNFDSSFLMDYNMDVGASQLMYLSSGPTAFDNNDLSPTFL